MAQPPASGPPAGCGNARQGEVPARAPGRPGPALARVVPLPVPAHRRRARAVLARVLAHLRAEATAEEPPLPGPSPRGSQEAGIPAARLGVPDDAA